MELQSIYRTYRPQRWEDLVGQELIVRTLTNALAHELLVHAYLFTGMRGVGKTTTARLLAKTVNCTTRKKGGYEPCNTCASCVAITEGRSLDVMEIDAASHTGVDNVRENIIAASRVASLERTFKVFIIDEVHMLSTAAFNALLKTLEEPPPQVLFILATTDVDRIPETIISRCQRFDFRRVTEKDIVKRLSTLAKAEGVRIDADVLESIVRGSEGALRDAESMFGQLLGAGKKHITKDDAALLFPYSDATKAEEFTSALLSGSGQNALRTIDDFIDRGGDVSVFLADCIRVVREMLCADVREGKNTSEFGSREALAHLLRRLFEAAKDATVVTPPVLALELLVAEYASSPVKFEEAKPSMQTSSHRKKETPVAEREMEKKKEKKDADSAHLPLATITERWKEVLSASKKHNHSLALILKVATPVSVEGNVLTLAFRYSFHADRLEEPATRTIARRILEEVFSLPLDVRTSIVHTHTTEEQSTRESEPPTTLLSNLLSTFGGKVVKKDEIAP